MPGPLAKAAERGADNAKVVSSTLTRTKFFFLNWNTLFYDFTDFPSRSLCFQKTDSFKLFLSSGSVQNSQLFS